MANNMSWGTHPSEPEDQGLQVRPMSLKVHYTFDKENLINCLARWPHVLQVQTVQLDEKTSIGVVDLKTCLQAVVKGSPELAQDSERDYAIYAYDYSEPDVPLVGQGMVSSAFEQGRDGSSLPQLVTGRITKNVLGIFGNGIKETLEVKFKLTAICKRTRENPTPAPSDCMDGLPRLPNSASFMSEGAEWKSLIQGAPNLGHAAHVSTVTSPALPPARPYYSNYEARNEVMGSSFHGGPLLPTSRPPSVDPNTMGQFSSATLGPVGPVYIPPTIEGPTMDNKAVRNQSRPSSRTSTRAPTGRPRGRPRKKQPVPAEGNTSGYEDGTDADDGPQKKRAKTTKVERTKSAVFGSASESLRVAASTSGAIRNFRPIAHPPGDSTAGNHLQDAPRAPTPVPDNRITGFPPSRTAPPSNLRRQSSASQDLHGSLTAAYMELNHPMSQGQDAHSPVNSIAHAPAQIYSDGPSPDDIGSSPPVPRSARFREQSSPAPSSPSLPPMQATQPDSGFMSGGVDDSRLDEDDLQKVVVEPQPPPPPASVVGKSKPKRNRSKKKQPPKEEKLIIHAEIPGPPELLPTKSLYNPLPASSKNAENPKPQAVPEPVPVPARLSAPPRPRTSPKLPTLNPKPAPTMPQSNPVPPMNQPNNQSQRPAIVSHTDVIPAASLFRPAMASRDTTNEAPQEVADGIEKALLDGLNEEQQFSDCMSLDTHTFAPFDANDVQGTRIDAPSETLFMERQDWTKPDRAPQVHEFNQEPSVEPELPPPAPAVPASDPVLPQLTLPSVVSEPVHPQTDNPGISGVLEGRSNKNYVRKQAINQKLEEAISNGELPQFCKNCGAIQTPTWRKIWKQEHEGVPEYHEYSEKPGRVTAINILKRDDDGKPTLYEIVKKTLGQGEDRNAWTEILLCNPCGIWFSKWKAQRPPEKWEKDQDRLAQVRRKRANNSGQSSRAKKPRTKSDSQPPFTSEACLPTDPLGPLDNPCSPQDELGDLVMETQGSGNEQGNITNINAPGSTHSRGSSHSRGSGRTPGSPIALDDDDLGSTRRLLFPSPRKDGEQKVLGVVAVNIVQTSPDFVESKEGGSEVNKENSAVDLHNDEFDGLFGTPSARPTTPTPKSATSNGPFKTPTRPTPSHRPITRSVSKSIRSSSRCNKSPSQVFIQRTPSRTPRSNIASSALRRRSPRIGSAPFPVDDTHPPESPFTKSINQRLSEANDFMGPSSHRGFELDFSNLSNLGSDGHLVPGPHFDLAALLSTDGVMPSSPPALEHGLPGVSMNFGGHLSFDGTEDGDDLWKHLSAANTDLNLEAIEKSANANVSKHN